MLTFRARLRTVTARLPLRVAARLGRAGPHEGRPRAFGPGPSPVRPGASARDPGPDPGPGAGGREGHELLVPRRLAELEPVEDGLDEVVDDRVRRPLVQVGLHLPGQERSGRVDRPFPE